MKIILIASILASMASCSRCERDADTVQPARSALDSLPPATQRAAGTFGCLLNGNAFIAKNTTAWGSAATNFALAVAPGTPGYLHITAYDKKYKSGDYNLSRYNIEIEGYVPTLEAPQTYNIGINGDSMTVSAMFEDLQVRYAIADDVPGSWARGQLILTWVDHSLRKAAGTFWFDAWAPGQDTVHVRAGRFDSWY